MDDRGHRLVQHTLHATICIPARGSKTNGDIKKKNGHISFGSLTSRSIAFEMLKLFIYGSHNDLTDNILNSINFI